MQRTVPQLPRLLNGEDLIDGDVVQRLPGAARPDNFETPYDAGLAEAEMEADVVAAEITCGVVDLIDLYAAGSFQRDPGAQAERIAPRAFRLDRDPVIVQQALVPQESRGRDIKDSKDEKDKERRPGA